MHVRSFRQQLGDGWEGGEPGDCDKPIAVSDQGRGDEGQTSTVAMGVEIQNEASM